MAAKRAKRNHVVIKIEKEEEEEEEKSFDAIQPNQCNEQSSLLPLLTVKTETQSGTKFCMNELKDTHRRSSRGSKESEENQRAQAQD